jgi:hypothetical protein
MNRLKIGLKTQSVAYINTHTHTHTHTNTSTVTIRSTFDPHPAGVSQSSVPVRVFLPLRNREKYFKAEMRLTCFSCLAMD